MTAAAKPARRKTRAAADGSASAKKPAKPKKKTTTRTRKSTTAAAIESKPDAAADAVDPATLTDPIGSELLAEDAAHAASETADEAMLAEAELAEAELTGDDAESVGDESPADDEATAADSIDADVKASVASPAEAAAASPGPRLLADGELPPARHVTVASLRTLRRRTSPNDKAAEEAVMRLWREYKTRPTEALRNRLIEHYLHIVRYSAERMHARLPGEVDVDDLMQAGHFGLMDAIDGFDLSRGVKFETFCTQRIRGAIFDELRSMDWVPRLVRARTARVEKVRKGLEAEFGRSPTDDELRTRLGVTQNEFDKIVRDSSPVGLVSLDRKWFETDSSKDVREIDVIKDTKQESPVQELQRGDLKHLVTKGLSRAERLIVVLYYYENMTMKEIGTTLDLSESRVSQMHTSILLRLKAQMQHRDKEV